MYVLYTNPTALTGRLLKQHLNIPGGLDPPKTRHNLVLNYGSSLNIGDKAGVIINDPSAVRGNTNKFASLTRMKIAGVNCPEAVSWQQVLRRLDDCPWVGRPSNHKSGKGFKLCLNKNDIEEAINSNCTHFLKYIPSIKEYRAHVFNGVVWRIQEKQPTPGADKYVHTHSRGWRFSLCNLARDEFPPTLKHEAIQAVRSLNLVFGAVDIGVDHNNKCWIFEVNTGASLDGEGSALPKFCDLFMKYSEGVS